MAKITDLLEKQKNNKGPGVGYVSSRTTYSPQPNTNVLQGIGYVPPAPKVNDTPSYASGYKAPTPVYSLADMEREARDISDVRGNLSPTLSATAYNPLTGTFNRQEPERGEVTIASQLGQNRNLTAADREYLTGISDSKPSALTDYEKWLNRKMSFNSLNTLGLDSVANQYAAEQLKRDVQIAETTKRLSENPKYSTAYSNTAVPTDEQIAALNEKYGIARAGVIERGAAGSTYLPEDATRPYIVSALQSGAHGIGSGLENISDYIQVLAANKLRNIWSLGGEDAAPLIGKIDDWVRKNAETEYFYNKQADLKRSDYATGLYGTGQDVSQNIGRMIPGIAANAVVPGSGLVVLGAGAAGSAANEALRAGATTEQALLYGTLSGAVEIATEKLFGGIPGLDGTGVVDDIVGKAISGVAAAQPNLFLDVLGEGAEEYLAEAVAPYLLRIYDETERKKTFSETWKDNQAARLQATLQGILTSGIMQAGNAGISRAARANAEPTPQSQISSNPTTLQNILNDVNYQPRMLTPQEAADLIAPVSWTTTDTIHSLADSVRDSGINVNTINNSAVIQEARNRAAGIDPTDTINTPERQTLRQEVTGGMLNMGSAQIDESGKYQYNGNIDRGYRADIIIGLPAAGKSSVLANPLSQEYHSRILDSDMVKEMLPEFDNGYGAGPVHEESKAILANVMMSAMDGGENIVYPVVGDNTNKLLGQIEAFRNKGYAVYLHLNEVQAKTSMERALRRFADEGRFIDPDVIAKYGDRPTSVYEQIRNMEGVIDGYSRFSNEVPWGQKAVLVERSRETGLPGDQGNDGRYGRRGDSGVQNAGRETQGGASRVFGPNTVGAAQHNPASYSGLMTEYDALPPGENPSRIIDVPAKTSPNENVTLAARTLLEAPEVSNEYIQAMQDAIADGELSYFIGSNQNDMNTAVETIKKDGYVSSYNQWENRREASRFRDDMSRKDRLKARLGSGAVTSGDIALGVQLMKEAMDAGDFNLATTLSIEVAAELSNAGQVVQAARMIKRATPQGQLYYLETVADKIANDLKLKFDKAGLNVEIDPALKQQLLNSTNQTEIDAAVEAIKQNIALQIPSTWLDKWNAWRYLSMLGNPKTHLRNILGNAFFVPARTMKNAIAVPMERIFLKEGQRTKAIINPLSESDRSLFKTAWDDYDNIKETALGGAKYEGVTTIRDIDQYRQIFKFQPLEWVRKANSFALDVEDIWFNKPAYSNALAGYMKANNLTEITQEGRDYAVNEAQKATYRDMSALATALSKLQKLESGTIGNLIINGILPFKKTPANILSRGLEYSPLGLAKSLTYDIAQLKRGKITASQLIDNAAAGMTGTMITALGLWLKSMGLITGGESDDEREQGLRDATGWQPYSLKIGDNYYSIDWISPISMPMFVGVELFDETNNKEGWSLANVLKALSGTVEPMYNMSMLQGVNTLLSSASFSEGSPLTSVLGNIAGGYLGQAIPTLGGQIARTLDDVRRDAYNVDQGSELKGLEIYLNRLRAKIPGLENQLEPYIDIWGRTEQGSGALENFASPGYLSEENITPVDRFISQLYESTGEGGVVPSYANSSARSLKRNGEKYNLTAEQYTTYAKNRGQLAYNLINGLLTNSTFNSLDKYQQADVIKNVYELATSVAKDSVGADIGNTWTGQKAIDLMVAGVTYKDQILFRTQLPDSSGKGDIWTVLNGMDLTDDQRWKLFGSYNGDWDFSNNIYSGVPFSSQSNYFPYADINGNGVVSQQEARSTLDGLDIPYEEKQWLWYLTNDTWKARY